MALYTWHMWIDGTIFGDGERGLRTLCKEYLRNWYHEHMRTTPLYKGSLVRIIVSLRILMRCPRKDCATPCRLKLATSRQSSLLSVPPGHLLVTLQLLVSVSTVSHTLQSPTPASLTHTLPPNLTIFPVVTFYTFSSTAHTHTPLQETLGITPTREHKHAQKKHTHSNHKKNVT